MENVLFVLWSIIKIRRLKKQTLFGILLNRFYESLIMFFKNLQVIFTVYQEAK